MERDEAVNWKKTLKRAPIADDGYMVSFNSSQTNEYLAFLKEYGMVVIKLNWQDQRFTDTLNEILYEANNDPSATVKEKQRQDKSKRSEIDWADATTWENGNWPTPSKFLLKEPGLGQNAFNNRTDAEIYEIYRTIYGIDELYCSVDCWGLMRPTVEIPVKDDHGELYLATRPDWRYELKPHWDLNPWLYVQERQNGTLPYARYQGLVALVDCPQEAGGFCCVPCCAPNLELWTSKNKPVHMKPILVNCPDHDSIVRSMQRIPLRRGEMVIWDSGTIHANFSNQGSLWRVVQYIRFMPAKKVYADRDTRSPKRMLEEYDGRGQWRLRDVNLTELGKKLLGVQPWPKK